MNDIVTTNLRIPRWQLNQLKTIASEEGVSFNTFVLNMLKQASTLIHLPTKKTKRESIWDLGKKPIKGTPMGASEDDKIIYDI